MTIGEFILARSPLTKDGTYSMEDHIQAMVIYVHGLEATLEIQNVTEDVVVVPITEDIAVTATTLESVVVNDVIESVVVTDKKIDIIT